MILARRKRLHRTFKELTRSERFAYHMAMYATDEQSPQVSDTKYIHDPAVCVWLGVSRAGHEDRHQMVEHEWGDYSSEMELEARKKKGTSKLLKSLPDSERQKLTDK